VDREARRRELYNLLGELPSRERPIGCRVVATEQREGYRLEKLILDLNGLEEVPAYFTVPLESEAPGPAVLYNHAHGGAYETGKEELTEGGGSFQDPPYARALAGRGIRALCVDHWAFGDRRGRSEGEIFREMLWRGRVMWGMMVYDSIRALDYMCRRDDVNAERIGTVGLSMGSTMSWWLAALDTRVRVCVDMCCMSDFHSLIESRGLEGHGVYYYVPDLLNHFDTAGINELTCPRAHLCLAGNYDGLTPPAGLEVVDRRLSAAYEDADRGEAWEMVRYDQGHFENADMRARVMAFLDRWLLDSG
jgi:hypothetical protein